MASMRRRMSIWVLAATVAGLPALTACSSGGPTPAAAGAEVALEGTAHNDTVTVDSRPFQLHVPASYRRGTQAPLVILLHGYTSSGFGQDSYLKITAESDRRGFLYATPDGTADSRNNRFWNATDACCNFYGSTVDDSKYVSNIITSVEERYTVDNRRVYLIGHSNGAFMEFRMACDHADQITAIAALNGAMWNDISKCANSRPVSVLNIRGTADETILYDGGVIVAAQYPSAAETESDWLKLDHCPAGKGDTSAKPIDLVADQPGAETTITRHANCAGNSVVETWTMKGVPHIPNFGPDFAPRVLDFLYGVSAAAA